VIEPPADVKAEVGRIQRAFAHLDWIAPLPQHFLHVTLGPEPPELDGPFEIDYRRVNCFHEAAIIEAHAPLEGLSHVSVGYVREPHDAEELRRALVPFREQSFGRATATELLRVRIPIARTTLFQPWTVLTVVAL
jgi:2'-5' RNA ligase